MCRPLLYLTVVLAATSLQAQIPLGPAQGRAFHLIQHSQWIPAGVDPALAATADSGAIVTPLHEASKSFGKGLVELRVASPDYGASVTIRISRAAPNGGVTIGTNDEGRLSYTVDNIGSVFFDLPAWFAPLPLRPDGSWVDSLVYEFVLPGQEENEWLSATLPDTAWVRRVRRGRIEMPATPGTGWVWVGAQTDVSLTVTSRPDYDEDPVEVRRLDILLGRWQERFLYDSASGQVDSVTVTGRLQVLKEFTHADGGRDTITGELVIERTGRWEPDGSEDAERRTAVFIEHGRDTTQTEPGPEPPYWSYRQRLDDGDTTAFEELIRLRAGAGTTGERAEIERILSYWTFGVARHAGRRFLELWRPGDPFFTRMATSYYSDGFLIDTRHARILISTFGTLAGQRTYPEDRTEGLNDFLKSVIDADSVTREAGAAFAQAAHTTDDPIARKIFLLGAYRADPAGFLPKIESVDTTDTFGRQVVAYANADPNRPYYTSGGEFRDAATFPGLDAPPSRHLEYMKAVRLMPWRRPFGFSGWKPGMLREWIMAHDPAGVKKLRSRFLADTAWLDKSVWATYLLQLGDTLPMPWLRTLAMVEDDSARARAYWVLELRPELIRDTLAEGPLLADLQNRLLQYATTGLGFGDSAELRPFSSHDERPDQRILATENLVSAILEDRHWKHRFEMLSTDSIRARAHRESLVMAFNITPVERILDRYYVDLNHSPYSRYGGGCLCGGGSMFVLEYRHGKWRVVSMGQWVS